ncbi:hypothetical protein H0H92_013878, partial [Tricholoma furcatifolium]
MSREFSPEELQKQYLRACLERDLEELGTTRQPLENYLNYCQSRNSKAAVFGKYKPVARKVKPVLGTTPEEFRIERKEIGDPLEGMPVLTPNPPEFTPTGRYTAECRDIIDKAHDENFLWAEEKKLVHHIMMLQNEAFAWNDEQRGRFREDGFAPVVMAVESHQPWVLRNIPIPTGIYEK